MKVLYFAWVRERVGKAEEELSFPAEVTTVADAIAWLAEKDQNYAHAFGDLRVIRAAVDKSMVPLDTPIKGAREIAFFPPVTGG
ncbi:molybdopterin converting factor subunit 1 [Rhodoligotrophos defluvii]|uniref:molybdopterin converting factor subunit 1 n=1 Tax=Rhodoligotrophos defluvii TaxID=2561934 RepID=UPI0010C95204|nr:molybdopterin converting factor subunit 1 [Rhodoligotrophos defluvii]